MTLAELKEIINKKIIDLQTESKTSTNDEVVISCMYASRKLQEVLDEYESRATKRDN